MIFSDIIHAVLLLMGFCVGLAVGSHQGLLGAVLGAAIGFLAAHLIAIGLSVGDLVVHGVGIWWSGKWGRGRRG